MAPGLCALPCVDSRMFPCVICADACPGMLRFPRLSHEFGEDALLRCLWVFWGGFGCLPVSLFLALLRSAHPVTACGFWRHTRRTWSAQEGRMGRGRRSASKTGCAIWRGEPSAMKEYL